MCINLERMFGDFKTPSERFLIRLWLSMKPGSITTHRRPTNNPNTGFSIANLRQIANAKEITASECLDVRGIIQVDFFE